MMATTCWQRSKSSDLIERERERERGLAVALRERVQLLSQLLRHLLSLKAELVLRAQLELERRHLI